MKKTRAFVCLMVVALLCVLTVLTGCNQGFVVTFDNNYQGGATFDVTAVDGKVTLPSDPVREGFTFAGWYFDAACTEELKVDFAVETFTANTTVYAKWTESQTSDGGQDNGNDDSTSGELSPWQSTDTHHWKVGSDGKKVDYAEHNTNGPAGSCADCGFGGGMAAAKKIYFYDYKNWGAVKSYTWKNGDDIDSWPGNTMEAWEGHPGWFVAEVEAIAVNIIFNNGSGAQTADLVVANGPYFAGENGCATLEDALAAIEANDFANHGGSAGGGTGGGTTSGATAYLMGIGGDWSTGIAMTSQQGMDGNEEFVLLNQVVGATDAFKVKVGDTWIGYEKVENNANLNVRPEGEFSNIKVPAGTYNIYYKPATGTIYIEAAE